MTELQIYTDLIKKTEEYIEAVEKMKFSKTYMTKHAETEKRKVLQTTIASIKMTNNMHVENLPRTRQAFLAL